MEGTEGSDWVIVDAGEDCRALRSLSYHDAMRCRVKGCKIYIALALATMPSGMSLCMKLIHDSVAQRAQCCGGHIVACEGQTLHGAILSFSLLWPHTEKLLTLLACLTSDLNTLGTGSIVVHVLMETARQEYNLEALWKEQAAPKDYAEMTLDDL